MDRHVFGRFLARLRRQLAKLSRQQITATHETVASHAARWACLAAIEAFGRLRTVCPRCPGRRFHRHGFAAGLQRYRCIDCGRTFNALTRTPLARLRRRECWLPYLQCMLDSRNVRSAANHAGVHRNTSFRWRHRFLMRTKQARCGLLQGIVEADETYLLESQKGSRHLNRPARRRGGVARRRGINQDHVCILVARDRGGATRDWVTGRGPVTQALLQICLPSALAQDVILVSDGARAYRAFAAAGNIPHEALNIRPSCPVRDRPLCNFINAQFDFDHICTAARRDTFARQDWQSARCVHGANMKPLLIVYYSRSGYTRRVAHALAAAGHADLEEIRPIRDYPGTAGIIRALRDTLLRREPALEPLHHCPADYQTVLIGGPVWAGRMAAPVRSFVATYGQGCQRLASFCTMAGSGGDAVFDAIARLAGKPLVWRAALSDPDIERGAHLDNGLGGKGCVKGLLPEAHRS